MSTVNSLIGLTRAAHGARQIYSPVRWCTVNKSLSTLTVHGWCQQPQSAQASVAASRMNDREMFTRASAAESPAVPGCWRRTDLRKQLHREDNVLHTLQNCAASPYTRRCRLGVGARCRNASVKLEKRKDWAVSGASFQNKCQIECWRLSSVSVLCVKNVAEMRPLYLGYIPKLLFTLCLC